MNTSTASTKNESDHVSQNTLPNKLVGLLPHSAVMYAAPKPLGSGTRSGGINTLEYSSSERPVIAVQQRSQDGDEIAYSSVQRQVTPAVAAHEIHAIDKKIVNVITDFNFDIATELSENEAFDIIKQARALLKLDATVRKERKDTAPSPATVAQYIRKCQLIDDAMDAIQDECAPPHMLVLSQYTHKKRSFAVMRAALKWRATSNVRKLLSAQDAMQITSGRSASWKRCVERLDCAIRDLKKIELLTHAECLVYSDREVEHSDSKKNILRRLRPDWREKFIALNDASPTYRAPVLLLRHCGFRPAELEKGIDVELVGNQLQVRVKGAKVRTTAGQPWRSYALDTSMMPSWFLDEIIQSGRKKTYSADRDSMRSHLARVSVTLYPRQYREEKKDIIISAYVFRHALVTDMRAARWETEEIAAALGESTSDTLKWYGLRQRTGSKRSTPVAILEGSIKSARLVRAVDHGDLNKVIKLQTVTDTKRKSSALS